MSGNFTPPKPTCGAIAPLLSLRDTGGLAAEEEHTVRAHLAECAPCRARAAADDIAASALRRHAGLANAPDPFITFDDVLRAVAQEDATPAPTIPPAHSASRRRLSSVAAIAAVLLIAVLAQLVFSSRHGPGPSNHPAPLNTAALAHDLVYVGTGNGLYAIHATTGTLAWRYPSPSVDPQPPGPYVTSCLTLASGVLYACSPDGIIALRARDGALLWHRALPDSASVLYPPGQGHYPSLGIANGVLYVSTVAGGAPPLTYAVFALSTANGNVLWRHPTDEPLRSAPSAANGAVYVATSHTLEVLRSRDGTLLWRSPIGGAGLQETTHTGVYDATITTTDSAVFVSTLQDLSTRPATSQGSASLTETPSLYKISTADGSQLWTTGYPSCACMSPHPPAVWQGSVFYVEDNSLWQLSAIQSTTVWRFTGYGELVGPVLAAGVLYLTDTGQDPDTHDSDTLALDPATDQALWRTGTQGGTLSLPPAVADGAVFSGGGTLLYALRADTGDVLWKFQTDSTMQLTSPLVGP